MSENPAGTVADEAPFTVSETFESGWAPFWHPVTDCVPRVMLSRNAAESNTWSPWSKIEKYRECGPDVIGVCATNSGVAPSYVVPAASPAVMGANPALSLLVAV